MRKDTINKVTTDLKEKYPDIGLKAIEVDDKSGKAMFYLEPTQKSLAFLPREKAATITRDPIDRTVLDLIKKPSKYLVEDLMKLDINLSVMLTDDMVDIDTQEDFDKLEVKK